MTTSDKQASGNTAETPKRQSDNLNSATDPAQVSTEVFEIDMEALKALPPEEQVQVLLTKFDKAKQEFVATVQINTELDKKFAELSAAAKEVPLDAIKEDSRDLTVSTKSFTYEGKKYGFQLPNFRYMGQTIGAAEILADKELQKKMVNGKFGILKPL